MDRVSSQRPREQQPYDAPMPAPPPAYPHAFPPPSAQPPMQFPYSDPFQSSRDPFLTRALDRRDGQGPSARAWPASTEHISNGRARQTPPQQHAHPIPASQPTNGLAHMSLPYDPSRRTSLGASGSPQHHPSGPFESLPPPPSFQSRHMPPPSPPPPSSTSSLPGSAPRGPPTASPFAGIRDIASYATNRPAGGMSISSILGGPDEKRGHGSPLSSTPKSMPPPSPGRARSSSMRESFPRGMRDGTPPRTIITEQPRPASAVLGHDRTGSEHHRGARFTSPQFRGDSLNNFRTFQPLQHDVRPDLNGHEPLRRPGSQPAEHVMPSSEKGMAQREAARDGRFGSFRPFGEHHTLPIQHEAFSRQETDSYQNGHGRITNSTERGMFAGAHPQQENAPGTIRFPAGAFGTPLQDGQSALFRPAYQPTSEPARESVESRQVPDARRDPPRSSPPLSEFPSFDRNRIPFADRPMTFEEHQRMEQIQREQQRKESDSSLHRAVFNISPDINRKERNSPLPQAVQGAQPRHIGPGGDNPNVQMAFGRMFSGLGSGVGTATPTGGHGNGTATPTRITPVRQVEGGDLVRTAVAELEGRRSTEADGRSSKKQNRRLRDDDERINGRDSPDYERGNKRAKSNQPPHHHHRVHAHHHHHHHQAPADNTSNPFNTIRFQPSQLSHSSVVANAVSHHHHHHHGSHAHPGHHHHHAPQSAPPPARKSTTTVIGSRELAEECATKPSKHLGSQLYGIELSLPPSADSRLEARSKFRGKMVPIPLFEGKENCTFTVRVPRKYLATRGGAAQLSYFAEICRRRQIWGTDVYTDDSDVVAAAVHSGWLKGDFAEFNEDLKEVCDKESEEENNDPDAVPSKLTVRPRHPVRALPGHDAHITLLILPPLGKYGSTIQHHVRSRQWSQIHDGMSFMIQRIEFVNEGSASRTMERGAKARKARIAAEELKRREAAAGLTMFAGARAVQAAS